MIISSLLKIKRLRLFTMLESEIEEGYDYWNDIAFINELDKMSADYKSGKVKGIPWEEVKREILNSSTRKK